MEKGVLKNFAKFPRKHLCQSHVLKPLKTNVPHPIEISQLICIINQLTGFCMMGNISR